ncbi:GyrI-like domain-containing protein [Anaerotignum sp. MB30-C6]|uniref:GyrI-like domain-containing protein n=1 Tax=Anaerotignum sp. MB30-C6 TaxID=3070814 RepID=UPI0027DCBF41|nr:GyrI-like domain-containing protein [Anaerotignum sp. MB30-C6]WMI79972.1 GyrI-like domain-containing protein [Anaerotignum sp. MB30-C6]
MEKIDYKKKYKNLYQPKTQPSVIEVPEMCFIQIDGQGNPNEEDGEYQRAVETLYALSYAIKMMPKKGNTPPCYFEYVVAPLEGLWWLGDLDEFDYSCKSKFHWTSMIRQPEFVTEEVFAQACEMVRAKKPHLDVKIARLAWFSEGLCVQCMHHGSFDDEPETLAEMKAFMEEEKLLSDLSQTRRHHEIYLSDPRKIEVSKMKTILRYPVRRM